MAFSGRRYEQPYRSKHVIYGTPDSLRAEEPTYIKNFSRFVHALYRKQTPFNPIILEHILPANSIDFKSTSRKTVSVSPERARTESPQRPSRQRLDQHHQQKPGFKTLGPKATKSPAPMSAMPSDFEHIFHYSDTSDF